jgi:hypothetical protein
MQLVKVGRQFLEGVRRIAFNDLPSCFPDSMCLLIWKLMAVYDSFVSNNGMRCHSAISLHNGLMIG